MPCIFCYSTAYPLPSFSMERIFDMTNTQSIYKDISDRTDGEIFIGVTGPVRSGKSTFIRKFMESVVLPGIKNEKDRIRTADELPQSAGGRTVMTTEPKFIPDEAVEVTFGEGNTAKVKLIDCVGYIIPDIIGDTENGQIRMVNTPWSDEPIPFNVAAETGTRKVITEHSTVGVIVTSDGSIGEIPRENYVEAESRTVKELQELGKPFVIVVNSATPHTPEAEALALELEEKYTAPVALLNCQELDSSDACEIMKLLITEFPIKEIKLSLPCWTSALECDHAIKRSVTDMLKSSLTDISRMGDVKRMRKTLTDSLCDTLGGGECITREINMGTGKASLSVELSQELFYKTLRELSGLDINDESDIVRNLSSLSLAKKEYDRFASAVRDVESKGYGIVMPEMDDLTLAEPEIVKHSGGYGVKLRATAPSIHMIKAQIETELSPIVGTEEQSEELVRSLLSEFEEDPRSIWNTNLFGKSIYELVNDGLHAKLEHMPEDARERFGETLSKVINEGASGLICILL